MVKKTALILMIGILLWFSYDAVSAFIDPSMADFMYIAELNSQSIDEYMSKNLEFTETTKKRLVNHLQRDNAENHLHKKYVDEFTLRDNGNYEFNNYKENYTIVSKKNKVHDLLEQDKEFQMLFDLHLYFENFYTTTKSILRTYYISDNGYMTVYPKQPNESIDFEYFEKKFLDINSSLITSMDGIFYMYEVHEDPITNKRIIAFQSPIIIDGDFRGNIVIEIEANVFDEITLKNYKSFATTNNLETVIYYDGHYDKESSGVKIFDDLFISRDFKERPIRIDKYIRRLDKEMYIYFEKNKIVYFKNMESAPIEYYQVTDINYFMKDIKMQLYTLSYMVLILLYYCSYVVFARVKEYIDNKNISVLQEEKDMLQTLVNTDYTTGLKNQKYLKDILVSFNDNMKSCYSVALCDVSFYTEASKKYGDKVAERALHRLIDIIKNTVSEKTLIFHWNEEELLIIFPETDEEAAVLTVDEIRKLASILIIEIEEDSSRVQVSFGVSVNRSKTNSPYTIIEEASKALTMSKKRGGNIVTIYSRNIMK